MAKKKVPKFRTELKKRLRAKNKLQTNKLIYAVAAGLGIILIIILIIIFTGDRKAVDKKKLILDTLGYLKKVSAITNVDAFPEENKALVIYSSSSAGGSNSDSNLNFQDMARYAAIRLSNEIKDEVVIIVFKDFDRRDKDYQVSFKNGEKVGEKLLD